MKTHDAATQEMNKAKAYANWSFIGLLIPILGIIFGCVSKSKLSNLKPTDQDEVDAIKAIRKMANWGIGLAIFVIVLGGAFGGWLGYSASKDNEQAAQHLQQEAERIERENAISDGVDQAALEIKQQQLQTCLDAVNTWLEGQRYSTEYQAALIVESKQQQIDECQMRYGN